MGDTPSLAELIRRGAKAQTDGMVTAMLAKVVSFNGPARSCKVKPLTQVYDRDGTPQDVPAIGGVPVLYFAGGGHEVTSPLHPGDIVILIAMSSSIEDWLVGGDPVVTRSKRRHSLSDCIALAGINNFLAAANPNNQPPNGLYLGRKDKSVCVFIDDTLCRLGSVAASDPVALATANDANWNALALWVAEVQTFLTALGFGGVPPTFASTAATRVRGV